MYYQYSYMTEEKPFICVRMFSEEESVTISSNNLMECCLGTLAVGDFREKLQFGSLVVIEVSTLCWLMVVSWRRSASVEDGRFWTSSTVSTGLKDNDLLVFLNEETALCSWRHSDEEPEEEVARKLVSVVAAYVGTLITVIQIFLRIHGWRDNSLREFRTDCVCFCEEVSHCLQISIAVILESGSEIDPLKMLQYFFYNLKVLSMGSIHSSE